MPTYTETWDVAKPAGGRDISLGDDDIRELKRALTERLGEDHEFQTDETGNNKIGYHKKVTLTKRTTDPSTVAEAGIFYTKDVGSGVIEAFYQDAAGNIVQLTTAGNLKRLTKEVLMWFGAIADIPSGFYLCNGSNGRPDLRDRFIVCATQDSGGVAMTNIEGSLAQSASPTHNHTGFTGSTTLSENQIPAHTHDVEGSNTTAGGSNLVATYSSRSVDMTITDAAKTTGGGEGHDHDIDAATAIPPYYALAMITQHNG